MIKPETARQVKAVKQLAGKRNRFAFRKSAVTNGATGQCANEIISPAYRDEIVSPRKSTAIYRQGRVIAPTPEEAARLVEEKYPGLDRITLFPCPVQPWPGTTWWEWVGLIHQE